MSVIELAKATLERIAVGENRIRAFAHLDHDTVYAEAKRLQNTGAKGPLSGEVIAVKDLFDVAGMPTRCGSAIYGEHQAQRDSAAVASIRAAGGLIIGKSVTTEFAYMTPSLTRNPHNFDRTPGGSSSGSAASVAAHFVTMATGTQTAGSIIRPAAFCGVVGFKPSFATISRSGLSIFGETLDTIGGFSRDVATVSRVVGVMADRPGLITPERIRAPKLALWRTPDADQADDAALAELERVANAAARAGAVVTEFKGGSGWSALLQAHTTIMAHEGARSLGYEFNTHPNLLSISLHDFLSKGAKIDGKSYLKARHVSIQESAKLLLEMSSFDAILTLSAVGEAPCYTNSTGNPHFNKVWTLVGGPAFHLPTGTGQTGMPLGVQICCAPQEDERAAAVALWLEAAIEYC